MFSRSVRLAYGPTTATLYALFQLTQFHLPYYSSRPLPNIFAFIVSTAALSFLLPARVAAPRRQIRYYQQGIRLLTFAAVVFRSELAILLGFLSIQLVYTRRISLGRVIWAGIVGGIIGLATTLAVDSYFWQSYTSASPFATPLLTPKTGLIWPELSGFLYNAVGGKSSEWGVSPWHYYFTSAIPKLLLNPLLLVLVPYAIYTTPRVADELYLFPVLGFVAAYSILPHKEWRFIIYVLPLLTLAGAAGGAWIWDRRRKGVLYGLAATAICVSLLLAGAASVGMSTISSWNYPGGEALNRLHTLLAESDISPPGTQQQLVVHLDTFTCMTGATRFLQDAPLHHRKNLTRSVRFDKTEDQDTLLSPAFWRDVDWLLTADPGRPAGRWRAVDTVVAWRGFRLYKPRDKVLTRSKEPATFWEEVLEHGYGLRHRFLKGYWLGPRLEESLWILRKEGGEETREGGVS